MRKVVHRFAVLLLFSSFACAQADDGVGRVVEVPVKEVWSLGMRGTRPIAELDPGERVGAAKLAYGPLMRGIMEAAQLNNHIKGREVVPNGPGLAVAGSGREALRAAHAVLTGEQEPAKSVSGSVTIVFHTLHAAPAIRLDSVQRRGREITVSYHFRFAPALEAYAPFALIPVGELEPGTYDVRFQENPYETGELWENVARKDTSRLDREVVCKDFSFEVLVDQRE